MELNNNKFNIYQMVNQKVRLEDVIRSYGLTLTKSSGNDLKTICPFHNDTNASLSVKTDKQFFKCFSCGERGTAIEFVLKMERKNNPNYTFEDAVLKLKNDFGLPIDLKQLEEKTRKEQYTSFGQEYSKNKISIIKMYENINQIFQLYLTNSNQGKKYLNYLLSRGLDLETIKQFQIGFCPTDAIRNYYNNIDDIETKSVVIESGLLDEYIVNGNRAYKDFFYERITFPLKDDKGNIIGFTARTLDPREMAKYKNSKESEVFKKSEILYNYDLAKAEAIKKGKIIILEGNMDVISSYALGLKNVVGLNGCELSNKHIQLLKQLNVDVLLALDNDKAGHNATIKTAELLEKNGLNVTCIDINDFGNFKDNGDILQESISKPELKNDFEKKYMSIEKSIFEFKLKYEYFNNKIINPTTIREVYSSIEHSMNTTKLVLFKEFCSSRTGFSRDEIQDLIDARNLEGNCYAKLGLSIITPYLEGKDLNNDEKELVVATIVKNDNINKFLIIKNNSIILNVENINKIIGEIKTKKIDNLRKNALKTEVNVREKQLDILSIEGIIEAHTTIYKDISPHAGKIRNTSLPGFCKPENIMNNVTKLLNKIKATDPSSLNYNQKINILSMILYDLTTIRMFEGPMGRIERYFIEKCGDYYGISIQFDKITKEDYVNVIVNTLTQKSNNDITLINEMLKKVCINNEDMNITESRIGQLQNKSLKSGDTIELK